MKELSIEKAKRYDKAIERAKGLIDFCSDSELKTLEYVFPELAESDDEKVRKALIDYFKHHKNGINIFYGVKGDDILAWLEKQGEKKPADNVEPKFNVGNWYQCTKDFFGKGVTFDKDTAYYCAKEGCLQNEYGCHIAIVKDLYDNFKLWTIKDAKDGDILKEDSCIFILQKLNDNNTAAKTYCTLHDDGDFEDGSMLYFDVDSTKPATKEQRDILFTKMHEAGYEWDHEKKELKKIIDKKQIKKNLQDNSFRRMFEQKSIKWSEKDDDLFNDTIAFLEDTKNALDHVDWIKSLKQRICG